MDWTSSGWISDEIHLEWEDSLRFLGGVKESSRDTYIKLQSVFDTVDLQLETGGKHKRTDNSVRRV